jgi:hypothetical protein
MIPASRLLPAIVFVLGLVATLHAQQPQLVHSIARNPWASKLVGGLASSVAVDGPYTVAGSPADDRGATDAGSAKVFRYRDRALLFILSNPTPGNTENFGKSVAISGTRIVVGTPGDDTDTGITDAGSVYVFDLASSTPTSRP